MLYIGRHYLLKDINFISRQELYQDFCRKKKSFLFPFFKMNKINLSSIIKIIKHSLNDPVVGALLKLLNSLF